MTDYGAETYGDRWADVYDAWTADVIDEATTAATVAGLAGLAPGRRLLELGIGTGRVALPLATRGFDVSGIDASEAIVAGLRAKPGGDAIPVTIGDFSDFAVDGTFDLVFVVFNTLFALTSQAAQVRCFGSVARHLAPGGVFVVEAFVPDLRRFDGGQSVRARHVTLDRARLEASHHDPVAQRVMTQLIELSEAGTRMRPVQIRYAWPSELDLMAQLAGLELQQRWGGWDRSTFTAASTSHVSVYGRRS